MRSAPRVRIDPDALRHNLAVVRKNAPGSRVLAIIKANAYGHGLRAALTGLGDADALGVARLSEAAAIRDYGYRGSIVLLEGVRNVEEFRQAAKQQFEFAVHCEPQLAFFDAWDGEPLTTWLKLDTGMNRLGFDPDGFKSAHARLSANPRIAKPLKLMTHLANAENAGDPGTEAQLRRFHAACDGLDGELSAANSAGLLEWPQSRLDWVRPGIMLYGISPLPGQTAEGLGLRPAMTFESELIAIRHVGAGEGVGYGGAWVAPKETRVGIVAAGYGDGYPRHAVNGTPVRVNDTTVPLVGRVSMDMIAVDLGETDARYGDPVVLWGHGLPVERVAESAGTIAYELLCGIGQRVPVSMTVLTPTPEEAPV